MDNLTGISFLVLAALLLLLERISPLRRNTAPVYQRWATNIGLALATALTTSSLFSASVIEIAGDLSGGGVRDLQLPFLVEAIFLFLFWDVWRYWQHRILHEVPLFWRVHLVHHSDTAIDVTTSQRHHPFESVITAILAFILVFALGFSAEALGIYLFASMLSAVFTHANIKLPEAIDRPVRAWLVTPSVHAMHHSSYQPETDSNYGAVLTIWDRLFGTYTAPGDGPARFGLEYFRGPLDTTLLSALLQPIKYRKDGHYAAKNGEAQETVTQQAVALSRAWRKALLYSITGLALALVVMWPTAQELAELWTHADAKAYQYAWLVVPMFVYLVGWHHRESIMAMTPLPGRAGAPLALAATALWLFAFDMDFKLGQQLGLVLVLQAIALCALGRAVYLKLLPTMLLLFFMIPCGDIATPLLRDLTMNWLEWFAILAGLPHIINGYFISFGQYDYSVLEACSGLGFFTLAGFLGYCFGLLAFSSLPRVMAMSALGAALGILTNALRVCLIVILDMHNGTQMDMAGHMDIQWSLMLVLLAILLLMATRVKRDDWSGSAVPQALARHTVSPAND